MRERTCGDNVTLLKCARDKSGDSTLNNVVSDQVEHVERMLSEAKASSISHHSVLSVPLTIRC